MQAAGCPSREKLAAYVLGQLPVDSLQGLAGHTARCPRCQAQLQAADGLSDALIDQIRHAPPTDPLAAEPQLKSLLQTAGLLALSSMDDPTAELSGLLAPPQAPDELGRLGEYRVLRLLGAGGMGLVLQAEDPKLRRLVALKVMRPTVAADPTARQRFLLEATATAALRNDHVITIYQVAQQGNVPFLAMQLLRGETLADYLERVKPVPLGEVLRIGREILDGLAAAHESGMIHRDIKPGNIWLEQERGRVKVLDFGLVHSVQSDARLTQAGLVLGTPEYMSPEQASGTPLDARSDLFSVGTVLYELCAGRSPFHRDTRIDSMLAVANETLPPLRAQHPRVPEPLANLIHLLLNKKPEDRPASARLVSEELQKIKRRLTRLTLEPAPATSATVPLPPPSPPRRRGGGRRLLAAVAVLLMMALVGGAFFWFRPGLSGEDRAAAGTGPASTGNMNDDFVRSVATMPEDQQYAAVKQKMREVNPSMNLPSYDVGKKRFTIRADGVTDLSPLRALSSLRALHCPGSAPDKGTITDLSPLKDLKLTFLDCQYNQIRDLSPIKEMPLEFLRCDFEPKRDTTLLKSMPTLRRINAKPVKEFWAQH